MESVNINNFEGRGYGDGDSAGDSAGYGYGSGSGEGRGDGSGYGSGYGYSPFFRSIWTTFKFNMRPKAATASVRSPSTRAL